MWGELQCFGDKEPRKCLMAMAPASQERVHEEGAANEAVVQLRPPQVIRLELPWSQGVRWDSGTPTILPQAKHPGSDLVLALRAQRSR